MSGYVRAGLGLVTALLVAVVAPAPASAAAGDTQPPTVPANFRITSVNSSQVFFVADSSTDNVGVSHYEFKLNGPNQERRHTFTRTDTGFGGLPSDTPHSVTIRAVDISGNASAWAEPLNFRTLVAPPPLPAPTNPRGEFRNGKLYALVWDAVPGHPLVGYTVYADSGTGPEFAWSTTETKVRAWDLIFSICLYPQTYTFTVVAGDSAPSAPVTLTLPYPPDA